MCSGLPSGIVDLKGYVSNRELLDYYEHYHIDLFLNVSLSEGLPLSIMEACSVGVPIVATNVGGVAEIVQDKENGILLDKDFSDQDLLEAILRFIKMDEKERERYRIKSRQIWCTKFKTVDNVNHLAKVLLGNRK